MNRLRAGCHVQFGHHYYHLLARLNVKMCAERILNVVESVNFENYMNKFIYLAHQPVSSNRYGFNDEIRFLIQHNDVYTLPSRSYLQIRGKLEKKSGSNAQLVDNAVAYLFEQIRYELNSVEIDKTRNLGAATLLKGLASMTNAEYTSSSNSGFAGLNDDNLVDSTTGNFSVCVPLKRWMGFFEDYEKIIISMRQELILQRASDDKNALYSTTTADSSKITIDSISWLVPYIHVSEAVRVTLLSLVEENIVIKIPFRSWEMVENTALNMVTRNNWTIMTSTQLEKPRYVLVSFLTNRKNQLNARNDRFDHVKLKDVKLFLNSEYYPYINLNLDPAKKDISFLYQMYCDFQYSYYSRKDYVPALSRVDFLSNNFMVVFDCNFQNDSIKSGSVDIRLEIETSESMPAGTVAHCLIIHDRIIQYSPLSGIVRCL